jgi:hypothetical protein
MLGGVSWNTQKAIMRGLTPGANLLAGSGDTDDDALAPALVTGLEGGTHDADVAGAVKGEVTTTISHLNQLIDNALAAEVVGVDEIRGTKLLSPRLLVRVDVDDDNLSGLAGDRTLNDRETDTASTEDGNLITLGHLRGDAGGAVSRGDAAAEQAGAVHGRVRLDGDDGDVGDDGVLGEGGCAHEVKEVLAAGAEARGAVGHDAAALGGADLAAEVGLAGLAELALAALGGVEGHDVVADLYVGDALADGLDDAGTLVSEDDGEGALGVLAREGVGVWMGGEVSMLRGGPGVYRKGSSPVWQTPV